MYQVRKEKTKLTTKINYQKFSLLLSVYLNEFHDKIPKFDTIAVLLMRKQLMIKMFFKLVSVFYLFFFLIFLLCTNMPLSPPNYNALI